METYHDTKTRTVMGRVCADDSGLSKGEPTLVMLLVIFGCYSLVSRIPNKSIIAKTPKLSQASSLCSTQPDTRGDTISTIHRGFIGLGLDYASPAQVLSATFSLNLVQINKVEESGHFPGGVRPPLVVRLILGVYMSGTFPDDIYIQN